MHRALSNDHYSWTITDTMGFSLLNQAKGPQDINHNSWHMLNWNILTMAGYITYPRHNADGLRIFIHVHASAKMWMIYAACETDMECNDWLDYQWGISSIGDGDFTYLDHTDGYNIMVTDRGCL